MRSCVMDMVVLVCFQESVTNICVYFCCIFLREKGVVKYL